MLKRTALKEGRLFKALAKDYYYEAPETTFSEALANCKNWLLIMNSVNECAMIMQKIANEALGATTLSKSFLNVMSMTKKDSDFYSATQSLMATVNAFGQMAKSEVVAKELITYIFKSKQTMKGEKLEDLQTILEQLEDKKESLRVKFDVGKEGESVEIEVTKKNKMSSYSAARPEILNKTIDLIKQTVEQAGQKYSQVAKMVTDLTEFLDMVNNYAQVKPAKTEEREALKNRMETHPMWEQFGSMVSFPETKEAYEYTMDVKSPSSKVVSKLIAIAKKAIAQAMEAMESPVAIATEWCIELGSGFVEISDSVLELSSEEAQAPSEEKKKPFLQKVTDKGKDFMQGLSQEPLALAASKRTAAKNPKVNRMDTDIEIFKDGASVGSMTTEQAARALNLSLNDKGVHDIVKALNERFSKEGNGKEAKVRSRMYDSKNKEIKAAESKKEEELEERESNPEFKKQLDKGTELEMEEHDVGKETGEKIAKDHLEEELDKDPEDDNVEYYEELPEMEDNLKKDKETKESKSVEIDDKITKKLRKFIIDMDDIEDEKFHTYMESLG